MDDWVINALPASGAPAIGRLWFGVRSGAQRAWGELGDCALLGVDARSDHQTPCDVLAGAQGSHHEVEAAQLREGLVVLPGRDHGPDDPYLAGEGAGGEATGRPGLPQEHAERRARIVHGLKDIRAAPMAVKYRNWGGPS